MLDTPPVSDASDAVEEAAEEVREAAEEVNEAAEELTTGTGVVIDDACIEKIADRVYDKTKALVTEMMKAGDEISEMVSETVSARAEEVAPPIEETAGEVEQDVKPQRSHRLFSRPMKKE